MYPDKCSVFSPMWIYVFHYQCFFHCSCFSLFIPVSHLYPENIFHFFLGPFNFFKVRERWCPYQGVRGFGTTSLCNNPLLVANEVLVALLLPLHLSISRFFLLLVKVLRQELDLCSWIDLSILQVEAQCYIHQLQVLYCPGPIIVPHLLMLRIFP